MSELVGKLVEEFGKEDKIYILRLKLIRTCEFWGETKSDHNSIIKLFSNLELLMDYKNRLNVFLIENPNIKNWNKYEIIISEEKMNNIHMLELETEFNINTNHAIIGYGTDINSQETVGY